MIRRYVLILAVLAFSAISSPLAVVVNASGKARTATTISSGTVTITVTDVRTVPLEGACPPAPAAPTFSLDLYDKDKVLNDAVGVDATEATTGVVAVGWKLTSKQTARKKICTYTYTFTVPSITLPAEDFGSDPDPHVAVTVAGTGGGTVDVAAPDLPTVASVDLGVTGPSRIATSDELFGRPIAGFSRGYDEISLLDTVSGLYFVSDKQTQVLDPSIDSPEGQVFLLSVEEELWIEQAYGVDWTPPNESLGTPAFLNVHTAPFAGIDGTSEYYFVFEGSSTIWYSPDASLAPADRTTYLELNTAQPISALAVEDTTPRGSFGPGDIVLYALEGSSAIYRLGFGAGATFLTANGHTFDGSTTIDFEYLDDDPGPAPGVTVGNITALSVAGPTGTANGPPIPPDRNDATDYLDVSPGSGTVSTLTISKSGGALDLVWGVSCLNSDTDYSVYRGSMGDYESHEEVVCTTGGATSAGLATVTGNNYFIVVPNDGDHEGSYGRDSDGLERPAGISRCYPKAVGECP